MNSKLTKLPLILSLLSISALAAPPQDLSVFEGTKEKPASATKPKRPVRLDEKKITVGDAPPVIARPEAPASMARMVRYDVICREQPGRAGKPKVKLSRKARVMLQNPSNNWAEVSFAPGQPTCWVPATAID